MAQGRLCKRGWNALEAAGGLQRLSQPLVRENGGLRAASWDEALDRAAAGLKRVVDSHGASSVGALGSARGTNEENYLLAKLMRCALGTNNIDTTARLAFAPGFYGLLAATGSTALQGNLADLERASVILVCSDDLRESCPRLGSLLLEALRGGARLILISPRLDETAELAELRLQPRPGSEPAWINGLVAAFVQSELTDGGARAAGQDLDSLLAAAREYPVSGAAAESGLAPGDLFAVAKALGNADRAAIIYGARVASGLTGAGNVAALVSLAAISGHLTRPGSVFGPALGRSNLQGAGDVGLCPDLLPGWQPLSSAETRAAFERSWGRPVPSAAGKAAAEMLRDGLRALVVLADDPLASAPLPSQAREALRAMDFLVVLDSFPTETSDLAQVVLPIAAHFENDGTFTNMERRVQRVRPAAAPCGEARPGWEVIRDLGERLGLPMRYRGPAEVMAEIAAVSPLYQQISYEALEEGWGLQYAAPGQKVKLSLSPKEERGDAQEKPAFVLTIERGPGWESEPLVRQSPLLSREYSGLRKLFPAGCVAIHPEDAAELEVREGGRVRLVSEQGEVSLPVRLDRGLARKTAWIPFAFREAAAPLFPELRLEPVGRSPAWPDLGVKVEKAD